jgi:glucokinase
MSLRFVVVDLRKTKIQAVRYTVDGLQEARVVLSTNVHDGADAGMRRIRSAIRQVWPLQADVTAIGLSVPGTLDVQRGVLLSSPDLPDWFDVPLRDTLVETFGVPTFVGKSASTAALAEHRFGAGRGIANMIYIALEETLESGVIFQNRLFSGGNGIGGEIGHIAVALDGSKPLRHNAAYLERLLSNNTIVQRARHRIAVGEASMLLEMFGGDPAQITIAGVCEAGRQGDAVARDILEETGTCLGVALVSLMFLMDPSLFVLGGTAKLAGDTLLVPMHKTVAALAPQVYQDHARVVLAQLGSDIGLWGALALCLMELGL